MIFLILKYVYIFPIFTVHYFFKIDCSFVFLMCQFLSSSFVCLFYASPKWLFAVGFHLNLCGYCWLALSCRPDVGCHRHKWVRECDLPTSLQFPCLKWAKACLKKALREIFHVNSSFTCDCCVTFDCVLPVEVHGDLVTCVQRWRLISVQILHRWPCFSSWFWKENSYVWLCICVLSEIWVWFRLCGLLSVSVGYFVSVCVFAHLCAYDFFLVISLGSCRFQLRKRRS